MLPIHHLILPKLNLVISGPRMGINCDSNIYVLVFGHLYKQRQGAD